MCILGVVHNHLWFLVMGCIYAHNKIPHHHHKIE